MLAEKWIGYGSSTRHYTTASVRASLLVMTFCTAPLCDRGNVPWHDVQTKHKLLVGTASHNSGPEQRQWVSSLYSSSQAWTNVAFRSTIILVLGPDPSWLAFSCVSYECKRISPGRQGRRGGGREGWHQVQQQQQNWGRLAAITGRIWSSSCHSLARLTDRFHQRQSPIFHWINTRLQVST